MISKRHVVVLSRRDITDQGDFLVDDVVIGTFRSVERAEKRAATIRRLALTYEDPEGVTGEENALRVRVEELERGAISAERALDALYES